MVRPSARPTRRTGSLAVSAEKQGEGYVLNTGGAYGGEMHLTGAIRLRLAQPGDELVMLREHDRARVIGAWTGVKVDGRRVVAAGLRWAETADAAEQRSLAESGLLRAASIGFSGRWRWRDELKPDELKALEVEGADLSRLQTIIDDVEVYEASLVAVGADEGARWAMGGEAEADEGEADDGGDGGLGEAQRLMIRHLTTHHGMTEADAVVEVLGPVLDTEDPPAEPDEAAADDAPAEAEADLSATAAPAVSPAVLSLLSPAKPAASGITHLLSPAARR